MENRRSQAVKYALVLVSSGMQYGRNRKGDRVRSPLYLSPEGAMSTTGYAYAVLQLDHSLNSYAGSGKVTVLGIGFADGVGVTDGRGAR